MARYASSLKPIFFIDTTACDIDQRQSTTICIYWTNYLWQILGNGTRIRAPAKNSWKPRTASCRGGSICQQQMKIRLQPTWSRHTLVQEAQTAIRLEICVVEALRAIMNDKRSKMVMEKNMRHITFLQQFQSWFVKCSKTSFHSICFVARPLCTVKKHSNIDLHAVSFTGLM